VKNVLLLESVTEEATRWLNKHAQVFVAETPSSGDVLAAQHPIHAIVTRGRGQVTAELIARCPELEVIARCGVGLDNVDIEAATKRGIPVVNAPGSNADTVAEHTLSLMLILQRNLYHSIAATRENDWNFRNRYQGDELRGKTLAILGLGDIGRKVAALSAAFGMRVVYWGRREVAGAAYPFRTLEQIWEEADIISLHLPLMEGTRHLLNRTTFGLMRRRPHIINTARGAIIDEGALVEALHSGQIGGFAADVLTEEPPAPDHPLLRMENVLITPHSASLTATTYNEMCVVTARNTVALLEGQTIDPRFIFNRDRL
jgi:phosphoglycerate dehydrogenase-like enzyme